MTSSTQSSTSSTSSISISSSPSLLVSKEKIPGLQKTTKIFFDYMIGIRFEFDTAINAQEFYCRNAYVVSTQKALLFWGSEPRNSVRLIFNIDLHETLYSQIKKFIV